MSRAAMSVLCEGPLSLCIRAADGALTGVSFTPPRGERESPDELTRAAAAQIAEYFAKKRRVFELPLAPAGTPFQKDIWRALLAVRYGETVSYGEIARLAGKAGAARAAGGALNRNPIAIIIPCHRVTGSQGALTGFAAGLTVKKELLLLENPDYKEGRRG
jgi:methylated-DNA-[protein]-cysteine S-methyltransferase